VKKTAAILLLGILAFNWVGYRLLSTWLESNANTALNSRIDAENYDASELISIKVANNLPYANAKAFERISGQIEIAGIQYNYVKIRVTNDSLELLCIPNHDATKAKESKDDFFKRVNDLQQNNQGKESNSHPGATKNFSPDTYTMNDLVLLQHPTMETGTDLFGNYSFLIPFSFTPTAEQPPEFC
jgi:hypothetical protein